MVMQCMKPFDNGKGTSRMKTKLKIAFVIAILFALFLLSGIIALFINDWQAMTVLCGIPVAMFAFFWSATVIVDWWLER